MRKLTLLVLLMLALTVACHASTVTLTFDYDYTTNPACTSTLTTNCVSGFQAMVGSTILGTIPNPTTATGVVTGITSPAFATSTYGNQQYSVVAIGKDGSGNTVLSPPATINVVVTPSTPKNPKGTSGN